MSRPPIRGYTPKDVAQIAFGDRCVLVCASIPEAGSGDDPGERETRARYLPAKRSHIREGVVQLARYAFQRNVQLIMGGHPAITPILLSVANSMPDSQALRVIIFQSEYFEKIIPPTTVQLANWNGGQLVWTPSAGPPRDPLRPEVRKHREDSLLQMREAMIRIPNLIGAVFIGGMQGVEQEADLLRNLAPKTPRYALANTGGAAQILFNNDPALFSGGLASQDVLEKATPAASVRAVFEDLGLP